MPFSPAPFTPTPYTPPDFTLPHLAAAPDVTLVPAPKDFVAPEGYHAMSIYPEYLKIAGQWTLARDSRMDCVAVVEGGNVFVREFRHIRAGDLIACGRTENGEEGILVYTDGFRGLATSEDGAPHPGGHDNFAFRLSRSRETAFSRDYDELYELLRHDRDHGSIVWVMGPAFTFNGYSREAFAKIIDAGYADAVFAGNALATHDLEGAYFHTSLGQDIDTQENRPNGHYHHLDTITRQPQFRAQPEGQVCVWLYGLFTDVPGDYVKKPMRDCTGKEICEEWLYHLGVPEEQIEELAEHSANTVPCMMPYITAFFMPRADGDRPLVVPEGAVNFAFIGQFAETPRDTIFTTEYSMRTGMEAVYTLLDIDRGVPEVWGSVFDLRVLLNATVLLRDGKPATDMNMNVLEKLLLSRGLKEIEHTDIYGLLKEFGVIPTTDENRDVPVPATGAVWPGIH